MRVSQRVALVTGSAACCEGRGISGLRTEDVSVTEMGGGRMQVAFIVSSAGCAATFNQL